MLTYFAIGITVVEIHKDEIKTNTWTSNPAALNLTSCFESWNSILFVVTEMFILFCMWVSLLNKIKII